MRQHVDFAQTTRRHRAVLEIGELVMICTCCTNGLHGMRLNRRAMLAGLATVSLSGVAAVPKLAFAADPVPAQSRNRILIKGGMCSPSTRRLEI
jgi:hypothetical protein